MASNFKRTGTGSWNENEMGSRSWASLMSGAEQNISSSYQQLGNTFKAIDHDSLHIDCTLHTHNPIKIIRRLTALEIALKQLKLDCETIFAKRISVVKVVVADQNEILERTEKVCFIDNRTVH